MNKIIIKNQTELDALPVGFDEYTIIEIHAQNICVNMARDNSSVVARDNSSVVAWGNSSVEAWDNSTINVCSELITLTLAMCAVAIMNGMRCKLIQKGGIVIERPKMTRELFMSGMEYEDGKVILYKSVNPDTDCDFCTGKIKYTVGTTVECSDFDPDVNRQCGGGLHLSPTKHMAMSYNNGKALKCLANPDDIVVYCDDVSKVRCRKVFVKEVC